MRTVLAAWLIVGFAAGMGAPEGALASVRRPAPCLQTEAAPERVVATVPAERLRTLSRGVNVTNLFGPSRIEDIARAFQDIARSGLRHVRIPISPLIFASDPPAWQAEVLTGLDQAVCAAVAEGLGIIIDLHPFEGLGPPGESVEAMIGRLELVWRLLAERYAAASPELVFFEVLNEPKLEAADWARAQDALAAAIRRSAPNTTLILTGSPWSTAASLTSLAPIADRNVVYNFHFYTPMAFTHQGASWSLPSYSSVHGLEFPASTDNAKQVADRAAGKLRGELAEYGQEYRSDRELVDEVAVASDWADEWKVPLVVTEFGVYGKAAPAGSRAAWLASARRAFEARGIGWTVWEYEGGFGVAAALLEGCEGSSSVKRALGLCTR